MRRYMAMAVIVAGLWYGLAQAADESGQLRVDVFGNVYIGDSPFSVGKVQNSGSSGVLRTDVFGNVYVGESPFSVGKIIPLPLACCVPMCLEASTRATVPLPSAR